ncbi:MAG: hypothetical protein ACKV2T_29160 [Kofleriaceae bacterium]
MLPDSPPPEDGAPPDMVASGTVNITTMARCCTVAPNTPAPNILVVGINTDGSVVTATSGANGTAQLMLREGASVSAVYPEDANSDNDVRTYVGVKPGDNLTFGDAYYTTTPVPGVSGQMTVNWAAAPGAVNYGVLSPCANAGTNGLTLTIQLYPSCQAPTMPLLIVAYDANYDAVGSVYLPTAAGTDGATVDIAAGQWVTQATGNVSVSISGLDPVVRDAYVRAYAPYASLTFQASVGSVAPVGGVASASLSVPTTAPSIYARIELVRNGNYGSQYFYKAGPAPIGTQHTNLPWIDGPALVSYQQRRAVWFETTGTYDAAVLALNWSRSDGKNTRYFNWTIILPPNVGDFRFPEPPAQLAEFLPEAKDYIGHYLTLVDLSSAASYDAARALPEWRLTNVESAVANGDEPNAAVSADDGGFGK